MLTTCVILVVFFIIYILLSTTSTNTLTFFGGKKRKHFYENIWDDDCLIYDYPELDDLLYLYEKKKIGKKLRQFLKWYKSTCSSRHIYNYLRKQGFDEYNVGLKLSGDFVSITGKKTSKWSMIAPHIIFIHKDHSCIRLKPIVGGFDFSYTPFPTVSFSIVYETRKSDFSNEAFKVTREGEPIPKSGPQAIDSCMNSDLSDRRIQSLMETTHIKLPKPSTVDYNFFRSLRLTE